MQQRHCLHLYTGNGKGKTTAAMGLALRACGHGYPVLIAQLMKDDTSGERKAFSSFDHVDIVSLIAMEKFTFEMTKDELKNEQLAQTKNVHTILSAIRARKPALMVFDELAMAMQCGLISKSDGISLIQEGLTMGEVIITGFQAPAYLHNMADYVSEIRCLKHPFDQTSLPARKGIEW